MVELLIVMAIAAVLLGIGVPSFTRVMASMRLSSTSAQLLTDLIQARSEAIKRNMRTLACISNSAGTDCGTGTDWSAGWRICYDADGNGSCDAAAADGTSPNPLVQRSATPPSMSVTGSVAVIRFNPNGTQGVPGSAVPVTVTLTSTTGTTRVITVAVTGNVSKE